MGTPSKEQIREMNPHYTEFKFPQIKAHPWYKVGSGRNAQNTTRCSSNPNANRPLFRQVFKGRASEDAIDLVSKLLEYNPGARINPLQACAHSFFNELRQEGTVMPNGKELPPLFNFTAHGKQSAANDPSGWIWAAVTVLQPVREWA